jgi:hypothetical protein
MKSGPLNLRLSWVPDKAAPMPWSGGMSTPEDVALMYRNVDELEVVRALLATEAQTAVGGIHALPQIEGAPRIIERPYTVDEAGQPYTAWNIFAVDAAGNELVLNSRLTNFAGGVIWLEQLKQTDIDRGLQCEQCRRYSHEQGQAWLNQQTHQHSRGHDTMWRDVAQLIIERRDVEAPTSLEDFGACLEDEKLVLRSYPGCLKFSARTVWKSDRDACQKFENDPARVKNDLAESASRDACQKFENDLEGVRNDPVESRDACQKFGNDPAKVENDLVGVENDPAEARDACQNMDRDREESMP